MVSNDREIAHYIEEAMRHLAVANAYSGKGDAHRERHYEALGAARVNLESALLLTRRAA